MAVFSLPIIFRYTELAALIALWLVAVSDGCNYKSECEVNQVCCSNNCINGSSCVSPTPTEGPTQMYNCWSDSDCSSWESCCSQSCVSGSNCVGQYCSSDTDCSSDEICCYGICQYLYDDCYDAAAVIAGSVIGSLVFVCMFSMCIFYLLRRRRTFRHRGVMVGQGVTATVTTTGVMQSNPPHPGQFPPSYSYQQGNPYYPPPQYEQQQHTTNPPPYNPGTAAASEPPPPYTAVPQAASRGLCAPKPSYGAVQSGPNININVNE